MMDNYTILHCHTMLSNATTTIDSVTTFQDYVDKAKECGMKALAISEHGSVMEWWHKKCVIEAAGMKYIHACEVYITKTLEEKIRDNYHCLLIAKNYNGVKELNQLVSKSFNREDGHYYYSPRLTYDELKRTSDNIIVSTACLGGILNSDDFELRQDFGKWLCENKHRCYLEIQHHLVDEQIKYNHKLIKLSQRYDIPLLATTDTHSLNADHAKGRQILQLAKNIHFDNEDGWDLEFKTYDQLCGAFEEQNIPRAIYLEAIENTNRIADSVEEFTLDKNTKYPKIYENSEEVFKQKINEGYKHNKYIKRHPKQKVIDTIHSEFDTYKKTGSIDFMLLQTYLREWEKKNGVQCGYSRGCFTKDAIVQTIDTLKPLSEVQIGDKVLSANGKFNKVLNTMSYDICEDMIRFEYERQGSSSKKYFNQCTTDHKILVNRDGQIQYVPANELNVGDLLCSPKIKTQNDLPKTIIDLQEYNDFGFEYDDNYIYEVVYSNEPVKYSSRWCQRNIGGNLTFWKEIATRDIGGELAESRIAKLLEITPFKTLENYRKYILRNRVRTRAIPRYIELDFVWNVFLGLMYGDGWTNKDFGIGLAVNRTTKNNFNRYVFYKIAERLGCGVTTNPSPTKNLDQLFINSKIINAWFKHDFFESKKGRSKKFNTRLYNQNKTMLRGIYIGLTKSDGSVKENTINFDNTSLSLIQTFRTLDNIVCNVEPMALDVRFGRVDSRGYNNKESYKIRRRNNPQRRIVASDDNYWFLKITNIEKINNVKTTVYDISVENDQSYVINNIVVHNSVSGSVIAYLLGITQMDSLKFNLNFFRFMNPNRVTNADIDTDYGEKDRALVKQFLLRDHLNLDNIQCAEIITFNTIATKGAVKDVARAMNMPISEAQQISNQIVDDVIPDELRQQYPELFEYVDIVNGTVMSIGSHPSGVLVTDRDIATEIGTCSLATSDYPVSMLNMKELDDLMYVKLDILGLDACGVINDACKLIGIERLNPDNVNLEDENVWKSIRDDTTLIFQWESDSAQAYLRKFMSDETIKVAKRIIPNFSYIKWFSFGNGLIRPACASYRDDVAEGRVATNGLKELDDFLAPTLGRVTMQEDIMQFLVNFCGYTQAESDTVRRGIAKKKGTEQLLPEIESRFIAYTKEHYNVPEEKSREVIKPFLQTILDASAYAFSWNHSDAYSCIGYINGYLRYYYPLEFLTAAFNVFSDNATKTEAITAYAKRINIKIKAPKFGYAQNDYVCDKETQTIYKGLGSIKSMQSIAADIMQEVYNHHPKDFIDVLELCNEIKVDGKRINSKSMDILINIGFFSVFGNHWSVDQMRYAYQKFGKCKTVKKETLEDFEIDVVRECSERETEKQFSGIDNKSLIYKWLATVPRMDDDIQDLIASQIEYLGYVDVEDYDMPIDMYIVQDAHTDKWNRVWMRLYHLASNQSIEYKCDKKWYDKHQCVKGNLIKVIFRAKEKLKLAGEDEYGRKQWLKTGEYENIISCYQIMENVN